MYWPAGKAGAICHAMLPEKHTEYSEEDTDLFKYVDSSVRYMHEHFRPPYVPPSEIEVKVFGGGDMFRMDFSAGRETVGKKNIKAAFSSLEILGYKVMAHDTGGIFGRKLYFYSFEGKVFIKNIKSTMEAG
jgi:chemotaxis protein CheD